jgi:hypothetical protein
MFVAASTAGAQAEPPNTTGNQFLAYCSAGETEKATCETYMRGLWDGAIAFHPLACLPPGVNHRQLSEIGLKMIRENPQLAHRDARQIIMASWMRAFPCPRSPARK